jgi:hypothetical protein
MQEYVNNYYDLGDQEALELKAIPLHYTAERRALLAKYDKKKAELKQGVPGLEFYIQNTDNNEAYDFVNNAYNYVTSPGADAPEDIKQDIAAAYNLYTDFIYRTNYIDSLNAANGTELKRAEKEKTVNAIKELIKSDSTRTIEQYYNYGLKKLINATTRDAKAGIWRNE